jgi:glycosyltransferase involved in cell wall biosynthesis
VVSGISKLVKNILYVCPSPHAKGGISSVVKTYLSSNLPTNYNIYLAASNVDGSRWVKLSKAIVGFVKTFYYFVYKDIHIVHVHGGNIVSFKRKFYYVKMAQLFRRKVIYHHHGSSFMSQYKTLSKKWKDRVKRTFEEVDLLICLSNSWRYNIQQIAPSANITVVPNSVELPKPYTKQIKSRVTLTFLGLIGNRKGVFDLLKVFQSLINKGYHVKLIIGGNGEIARLIEEIKELGLADNVQYRGWISDKEKDLLLDETDIFVLPSYAEGMPMSILEAMAHGVPVVSTLIGGIPELVLDGETGFLIRPGDLDALYQKIVLLIENENLRKKFGDKGRLLVRAKHRVDVISQTISNIYNSL